MEMKRFRVTNFRSIHDSGWVESDEVTALIGTNESGKSNLLIALWKLKPAREGQIDLKSDAPRKRYAEIRNMKPLPIFIQAEFEVSLSLRHQIARLTSANEENLASMIVARNFSGDYDLQFPNVPDQNTLPTDEAVEVFRVTSEKLDKVTPIRRSEESSYQNFQSAVKSATGFVVGLQDDEIPTPRLIELRSEFEALEGFEWLPSSSIAGIYNDLNSTLSNWITAGNPIQKQNIVGKLEQIRQQLLSTSPVVTTEEPLLTKLKTLLAGYLERLAKTESEGDFDLEFVKEILEEAQAIVADIVEPESSLGAILQVYTETLEDMKIKLERPHPNRSPKVLEAILTKE